MERALAESWPAPTRSSVVSVLRAHHVRGQAARAISIGLFTKAMRFFIASDGIDAAEARMLRHLQSVLGLIQRDLGETYRTIAEQAYAESLSAALDDEDLSPEERARLDALTAELRVSPERRGLLFREQAQVILQRLLGNTSPDRLLSPEEHDAIQSMAEKFGMHMNGDVAAHTQFDRFSLMWQIENGELPTVTTSIALSVGEVCHFYAPARWHEWRRPPAGVVERPQRVSSPVMRGLSYRAESRIKTSAPLAQLTEVSAGTLYITNRRLLLLSESAQRAVANSEIVALAPYTEGFGIETASGSSPVVTIDGDVEIATAIAAEVLARS